MPSPPPSETTSRSRFVVGCMTGTSLDGLDAALVEIVGEGATIRFADDAADEGDPTVILASGSEDNPIRDVAIRGLTSSIADSTQAIQSAIDEASAAGGRVLVPPN